ncbi:MAG: YraN family protein [Thiobacillus sp. 63-78]|uniref:YraN family protein n=1 Tax=Thiobacillus sp. 63-78 TaxID=1895859 RepID=UPI00086F9B6D|nr:YraN family protein [Thiobacillus sp. 63-78]MBN8762854.1 YraN family protein [Thiobacillus sp.]ODV10789.1 MAG: YraN family protein [Thiobacillus sp. SCN 64-317]MBN8765677.1 YraN family protein [Thiobacillus sp.]MBN8773765.1 YraN family protein [Thiobacillus sp.]OJZ04224.1 MAG: YraN family protein [Thiobacillus sp. 63-78]
MLRSLLGQTAEARAAAFLQARGLKLLARNWRCRFGEIDLIMRDGATLVFIEVRLRSRNDFGGAAASVTPAKQRKLLAAARQYLATLKTLPPCRFDVVALSGDDAPDWIRNAFDDMG